MDSNLQNTNTFQLALFITDNGTFANYIYKNIGWTQGAEVLQLLFAHAYSFTEQIIFLNSLNILLLYLKCSAHST